jgi:nitronate monooxygenase
MFQFSTLKLPIIQAPMAGGINTPGLASAVSNAGGVGSFGFSYSKPDKINKDLIETRALTNGAINANFFVFSPTELPSKEVQSAALEAIKGLPIEGDFAVSIPQEPFFPNIETQLVPIWEHRPEILTFHFGIPTKSVIERARSLGISVGITATNLNEALEIERAGASFIVAQGIEAGGHRGAFNPDEKDHDLSVGELVRKIVNVTSLPIVAAGAIMTGANIDVALKLGATAVQMGTAFLCCDEAGTSESHKEFLLNKKNRTTLFTKSFSGRRARGINNEFIRIMEGKSILPFPIQNTLTNSIRKLAVENNDGEYQSLWAGKSYDKTRSLPAKQLMIKLEEEIKKSQLK